MKAVLIKSDKALSYEFVPDPEVKADDILIKVKAAGVNRADLLQREGKYPTIFSRREWKQSAESCSKKLRSFPLWTRLPATKPFSLPERLTRRS